MAAHLDDFERWGFDTRAWSGNTRKQYRRRVEAFERWLTGKQLRHASTQDAQRWLASLPATVASRNQSRKALVAYGEFLAHKQWRAGNPFADLPRLRERPAVPRAITVDQAQALYRASTRHGVMWRLMVALWLTAGLRCSELRLLRWDQVEDDRWLRVNGKGGKTRVLPLREDVAALLVRWRGERTCPMWVFPSPAVPGQALSANWMRERLREMAAEAGIEGRMHPHLLRATFATRLIELGVAVHDISDLMGHRDVSTLAHYVASRPERLAVAVEGLDLLDVA